MEREHLAVPVQLPARARRAMAAMWAAAEDAARSVATAERVLPRQFLPGTFPLLRSGELRPASTTHDREVVRASRNVLAVLRRESSRVVMGAGSAEASRRWTARLKNGRIIR